MGGDNAVRLCGARIRAQCAQGAECVLLLQLEFFHNSTLNASYKMLSFMSSIILKINLNLNMF